VRALILFLFFPHVVGASVPIRQERDGSEFSISVNVDVAVFNVSVTDGKGRYVSGLKASDFRVVENGEAQEIRVFSPEDVPATIGLVIDNSGSMRNKRADVQRAALAFLGASNMHDELFLVSFNDKPRMELPHGVSFSSDHELVQSVLLQIRSGGMTALYDAMAMALQHVATGTQNRKALVILSDGGDNASSRKLNEVLELARRSSATIYTIGIYDENDPDKNPRVLRRIAEASGGRAYFPKSLAHLDEVWRAVAAEIRSQYTIGYVPRRMSRSASTFRSVKIIATRNGGKPFNVTTRDGYVIPEN